MPRMYNILLFRLFSSNMCGGERVHVDRKVPGLIRQATIDCWSSLPTGGTDAIACVQTAFSPLRDRHPLGNVVRKSLHDVTVIQ